jgi:hypothetical protein
MDQRLKILISKKHMSIGKTREQEKAIKKYIFII